MPCRKFWRWRALQSSTAGRRGKLAQGETGTAGLAPGGKMLVFCGMERELDQMLGALRAAGIVCLKAVLTPANRDWTPGRLYRELEWEHRAMGGR